MCASTSKPFSSFTLISHAIQVHAEGAGFSVIRDFVGHGVGRDMHEDPQIPNYGKALDAFEKAFSGNINQPLCFRFNLADSVSSCCVTDIAFGITTQRQAMSLLSMERFLSTLYLLKL